MNIIFLGSLFSPKLIEEIEAQSKGGIQYASNNLQWNYIKGLDAYYKNNVKIINAPIVGSFPSFYKKLIIPSDKFNYNNISNNISVGYCNVTIIKNYFIKKALLIELKKWAKKKSDDKKIIIVYGMISPWMLAAINIKRLYPNIKLCLIIPDLPQYMNNSNNIIFKIREYLSPNLYKYIPMFDSFVFLTKQMDDYINSDRKPSVIIEGMVNPDEFIISESKSTTNNKIIMYTGTLAERYGILDLLDAFSMIEETSYELWICGNGNTKNRIIEKATKDHRIKFLGLLNREKVLKLQKQATVLINPRNTKGEYTKYSFPSKIMEYLLSGTPCIMYSLPGIPTEYNDFIFYIDGEGPSAIKNKILEVCSLNNNELIKIGKKAQSFVLEKKNFIAQTGKLTKMLIKI